MTTGTPAPRPIPKWRACSALPCRLHLPDKIRHQELGGRRPIFRPRDHREGRRRRCRQRKSSVPCIPATKSIAYVRSVHDIDSSVDPETVTAAAVEATPVRCPDPAAAEKMIARIKEVRSEGDSIGGTIECVVRGVPPALGEPVFDKLEADLAKAMMSLRPPRDLKSAAALPAPASPAANTTTPSSSRRARLPPSRTAPEESREASATASTFSFASPSSRPQPSPDPADRHRFG